MSDSHRAPGGASPFAQGVVGAAACGIAAIPLAVVLTLIAGIFGDTGGLGEIVLGFALYGLCHVWRIQLLGFLAGC